MRAAEFAHGVARCVQLFFTRVQTLEPYPIGREPYPVGGNLSALRAASGAQTLGRPTSGLFLDDMLAMYEHE